MNSFKIFISLSYLTSLTTAAYTCTPKFYTELVDGKCTDTANMAYITTKAECEAAALEIWDSTISEVSESTMAPGCIKGAATTGGTWTQTPKWNTHSSSTVSCGAGDQQGIERCACITPMTGTGNNADGSCQQIDGCMDATAFNYNADANLDDGTCIATVEGCTDTKANNTDAFFYTELVSGKCTDSATYITTKAECEAAALEIWGSSISEVSDSTMAPGCIKGAATALGTFTPTPKWNTDSSSTVSCGDGWSQGNERCACVTHAANVDDGSCEYVLSTDHIKKLIGFLDVYSNNLTSAQKRACYKAEYDVLGGCTA